jgi:XTP/dITP diphosphohydrolase
MSLPKLLIATRNPGKVREYSGLLRDLPFQLVSLDDASVTEEVEETGLTFQANAALKAGTYASLAGMMALADDSGLEVDALGGEPGVHSARYGEDLPTDPPANKPSHSPLSRQASQDPNDNRRSQAPLCERGVGGIPSATKPMSDQDRVTLLLNYLRDVPWGKRTARFRCVICIAQPGNEGDIEIAASVVGSVAGMIQYEPRGEDGFGYDPVFYLPSYGLTLAQISMEEKNRISHRADASGRAQNVLRKLAEAS